MRRLITLLLLIIYFNVAWGSAFEMHYCCGHFSDISLVIFNNHKYEKCKTKNSLPDCCKDKSLLVKTDNHKTQGIIAFTEYQQIKFLPPYLVDVENNFFNAPHSNLSLRLHNFRNHFPLNIFLLYCNLRI